MYSWLDKSDFTSRIKLSESVPLEAIEPFIVATVDDWLLRLIGPEHLLALADFLTATPLGGIAVPGALTYPADLYELTKPFLVYASFADYVMFGTIIATSTGLVNKTVNAASAISDIQRAQLSRFYKDLAQPKANLIAQLVSVHKSCEVPVRPAFGRFSSSQGMDQGIKL